MYVILSVGIWILGAVIFYILDGWFEYSFVDNEDDNRFLFGVCAMTWPLWIWLLMPVFLAQSAHDYLREKKNRHLVRKETHRF